MYNAFLLPPGVFIIMIALCIWLCRREKKVVITLSLAAFCLYLFSTQFFGNLLIRSLEQYYQPPSTVKGDVIIMLGGGATLDTPDIDGPGHLSGPATHRMLTAFEIYKKIKRPIIVSGGRIYDDSGHEAMIAKRKLTSLGVPAEKIIIESQSRSTEENAQMTAKIMKRYHFKKPILVTSAFHMRRSVMNFDEVNIRVNPYPTDYLASLRSSLYFNLFAPCNSGLSYTGIALHEYLGILAKKISPRF